MILFLSSYFWSIVNALRRIVAPSYCFYCQIFTENYLFLCSNCVDLIIPMATKEFYITDKYRATVFAVSDYSDPLRMLTHGKYYKNQLASVQLAQLIWERTDIRYQDFDIIVSVPLHWTRYAWRWYNQSDIMAEALSKLSGKPFVHILKRNRRTLFQTGLLYPQRTENVKEAFELLTNALEYTDKKILVVDDVLTTGATLYEVGRLLIRLKPSKIIFAVACRVGSR